MKEVYLYKKLEDPEGVAPRPYGAGKKVQCQTCAHNCVIPSGKRGICGVRENRNGTLYALNYGKIIARCVDPIEKKPFFHFLPGSKTYSIATVGCNFRCDNCQNWDISQSPKNPERKEITGEDLAPGKIVEAAINNNCSSIAYTYTEPTIFLEFALDTMKIARKKGLKNVFVSNGFMSPESAESVIPYLDANRIDIKSFSDEFYQKVCGARLQPVLDTCKLMKKSGVWVEIITLVIPTLSDSEEMFRKIAGFIHDELGPETPWHVTQFSGVISWKLQDLPDTPAESLEKAYKIGKEAGLKYVYTGNVPGLPSEDTFCPKCGTLSINRLGYSIKRFDKDGRCPKCKEELDIRN